MEAFLRILLKAVPDDPVNSGGIHFSEPTGSGRSSYKIAARVSAAVLCKGALTGHHLKKHAAEREEITPGIDLLATDLLRRHVPDGPHNHAGIGQGRVVRLRRGLHRKGRFYPRQAEVEDFDPAVGGQEEVLRLQIPVGNILVVPAQRPSAIAAPISAAVQKAGPPASADRAGSPLQQLHHRERGSLVRAEIVDGQDIRMRQRRHRLRLALEPR